MRRFQTELWIIGILAVLAFLFQSCEQHNPDFQLAAADADFLHETMQKTTDVIVHDIFSPPVASRIYAYTSIAGYEAVRHQDPSYLSFAGQLNELKPVPQPDSQLEYCFPIAGTVAMFTVGKQLIFSEDKMDAFRAQLDERFAALNMPPDVYERSVAYGEQVAAHVLKWADGDLYKESRTFPKFTVTDDPNLWKPTPPDYMDGIEPAWRQIRTMVLDSAQQCKPAPPTAYSEDPNSLFYKETMEVYHALNGDEKTSRDERINIAKFWDCNPYVSHHKGHVMFATKKITPGGHWIGIAQIAAKQTDADIVKTAATYALTSIGLFDAFISCWDEKYRSNLVRPETYINRLIDENWYPALQTPPFPEYTSGHSVASRAAALALTSLYGDNFAYDDTVEVQYGLPVRSYTSFLQASEEAAISRLYGGIHYMPAITNGVAQGADVGNAVLRGLEIRKKQISSK